MSRSASVTLCEDCGRPLAPSDFDEREGFPYKYEQRCNRLNDDHYFSERARCHAKAYIRVKAQLADTEAELQREKLQLARALRGMPLAEARRECEAWRALAFSVADHGSSIDCLRAEPAGCVFLFVGEEQSGNLPPGEAAIDLALKLKLIPEKAEARTEAQRELDRLLCPVENETVNHLGLTEKAPPACDVTPLYSELPESLHYHDNDGGSGEKK